MYPGSESCACYVVREQLSQSVTCLFILPNRSLAEQRLLILMKSDLSALPFMGCVWVSCLTTNCAPNPRSQVFSPVLSCISFLALHFTCRSIICLELRVFYKLWSLGGDSFIFSFLWTMHSHLPFGGKSLPFLHWVALAPLSTSWNIGVGLFVGSLFCSIDLCVYLSPSET